MGHGGAASQDRVAVSWRFHGWGVDPSHRSIGIGEKHHSSQCFLVRPLGVYRWYHGVSIINWPFQKVHLKIFLKTDSSSENLCELFKLRCYSVDTFSAKTVWAIGSSRAKKLARCVRFVVSLQHAGRCTLG